MAEDRIARIQRKMLGIFQEEMRGYLNDLMKGVLDPSKIMGFIKAMGFDPSKLPGMMGQQPGFDPYRVLGLEKTASDNEVKQRYRTIIFKIHPDKAGQEMTFLTALINLAYQSISKERGGEL